VSAARGIFLTFEGGEGAGKSTAAARLAAHLRGAGREVVLTREPGGTPGAEAVRKLLLDPATSLSPLADTMLHFAARADHVAAVIRPALARGATVICDRFYDSTMAYQGFGMTVDVGAIAALIRMVGLTPDRTFIMEVSESVAKTRLQGRRRGADRYDLMGSEFFARVAAGFRAIAAADPERCTVINADADPDTVFSAILAGLKC
jgi:dTMP kinase